LFDRLPRGVRLKRAGTLFLSDARRILQTVEERRARAESGLVGKAGTLRIGIATCYPGTPLVVTRFGVRRRETDVETGGASHAFRASDRGCAIGPLDAGFAASMTPCTRNWRIGSSRKTGLLLAGAQGAFACKANEGSAAGSANVPFILVQRWTNPTFDDELMEACARGGLKTRALSGATDRDTS